MPYQQDQHVTVAAALPEGCASMADMRIGMLARHMMERDVETNPRWIRSTLEQLDRYIKKQGSGTIRPQKRHRHYYYNTGKLVCVTMNPLSPIIISDKDSCLAESKWPASVFEKLLTVPIGARLSTYITIDGFDVDALAPAGIGSKEVFESIGDNILVLAYEPVTYSYLETAAALRARADELIGDEVDHG